MIGHELEATTGREMVRVVRALGQHRYVAGRLHLVHAFAIDAAFAGGDDAVRAALGEAKAWADGVLADDDVDKASKDERLHRRATDAELAAVLSAFWANGAEARERASLALAERLVAIEVEPPDLEAAPFDESREEDVFPLLVDAGWELLPLAALEPERHKGAIAAFEDFEVAKFEEESAAAHEPPMFELPALGALELLAATDEEDHVRAPLVVWASGHEVYIDYLLRGVRRAAKLTEA